MIEKPRIGSGQGYIWAGAACYLLTIFCAVAASGGGSGAGSFAVAFGALASGLVFLGFWKGLFSKIELRLIDIQRASSPEPVAAPAPPPAAAGGVADNYLG